MFKFKATNANELRTFLNDFAGAFGEERLKEVSICTTYSEDVFSGEAECALSDNWLEITGSEEDV